MFSPHMQQQNANFYSLNTHLCLLQFKLLHPSFMVLGHQSVALCTCMRAQVALIADFGSSLLLGLVSLPPKTVHSFKCKYFWQCEKVQSHAVK